MLGAIALRVALVLAAHELHEGLGEALLALVLGRRVRVVVAEDEAERVDLRLEGRRRRVRETVDDHVLPMAGAVGATAARRVALGAVGLGGSITTQPLLIAAMPLASQPLSGSVMQVSVAPPNGGKQSDSGLSGGTLRAPRDTLAHALRLAAHELHARLGLRILTLELESRDVRIMHRARRAHARRPPAVLVPNS